MVSLSVCAEFHGLYGPECGGIGCMGEVIPFCAPHLGSNRHAFLSAFFFLILFFISLGRTGGNVERPGGENCSVII